MKTKKNTVIKKLKTRKSITKRFKITKTGKVLRRAIGQGHNRAKKSGNQIRERKKWVKLCAVDAKKIKKLLGLKA
ncbi:MAG: 50S ribosomal protein L35 [Patescibacteria group bacterium]|nr:50S ribosomal protein L35 [Patescibacteria group bacterium]